jgi:phospholipase/carboxylesterase
MNRIQGFPSTLETPSAAKPTSGLASSAGQMGAATFSSVRGDTQCAVFAPLHYESNYAYPLLVWLHGPGDDENQLKRIMPLVSMRNYVGVGPRGTLAQTRQVAAEGRERTATTQRTTYAWSQTPTQIQAAEQQVFDSIDLMRSRFNISADRVFLAGFDCGGTMAFRLALSHPQQFAGVLSLGGEFPSGRNPLGRLHDARRLPIFLACGRKSRKYPSLAVCENLRLFHTAGLQVALRDYPCGQEISSTMLSDMNRWMMEQITGVSTEPAT